MKRIKMIFSVILVLTIGVSCSVLSGHTAKGLARSLDCSPFYTDMYFGYSFDGEGGDQIHIFANRAEVERYVATLTGSQPDLSKMIEDFFEKYDTAFFADNKLVIAIVDRGSGSLRFEVDQTSVADNILQIKVNRLVPFIQTMDYRQWVMVLPVSNNPNFDTVNIIMRDVEVGR